MGSVDFTRGPFEAALGSRPITMHYSCFAMDKVKHYSEYNIESQNLE